MALVSQPIYMRLFGEARLNVIFTLAVCLMILKLIERPNIPHIIISTFLTLTLATGLFEYGSYAVLMVLIYKFVKKPSMILLSHFAVNLVHFFFFSWIQQLSILGSIIIVWYLQGLFPEIKISRFSYRAFYPVHILFLLAIKIMANV